jgi:diaminohydroxyphosphoribosylaminopyrimidine deaminase/5-amino-6-(5-phosphoribosylamino)uracil reductase
MIGKKTALADDPLLTNRYWSGPSPIRIVTDTQLQLPGHLQLFRDHPTWILNEKKEGTEGSNTYIRYPVSGNRLDATLQMLGERNLMSILVEGGPSLLNAFLKENCWDEIRTITNTAMTAASECHAPVLPDISPAKTIHLGADTIQWYYRQQN